MKITLDDRTSATVASEPGQVVVRFKIAATVIDMAMTPPGAAALADAIAVAAKKSKGD